MFSVVFCRMLSTFVWTTWCPILQQHLTIPWLRITLCFFHLHKCIHTHKHTYSRRIVETLVLAINQLTGVIPTELCAMIEYDSSDKAYTESNTGCTERAYGGAFCPSAECCGDCVVWEEDTITDPTKGAT